MLSSTKSEALEKLRNDILHLQGYRAPMHDHRIDFGLGEIEKSFPNGVFPTGAVHEFVSDIPENAAATSGFMATLLGPLMQHGGICLWVSTSRVVFPPGLAFFGVQPERIIFIDLKSGQDLLWVVEEALKCNALAVVVGEVGEVTLTESRRLQLAVEQSRVTGFLHRHGPRHFNTLASVSRWKVTTLPSELEQGMPGVGHPRWQVQLQKVRNGEPGTWNVEYLSGSLKYIEEKKQFNPEQTPALQEAFLQTG